MVVAGGPSQKLVATSFENHYKKGDLYGGPIFFHMEGSFTETTVIVGIVNFKWCMAYGGHTKLAGQAL
jgi:hypothetical protein